MPRSYKDKLTNFEVQPPPDSWDNIAQKLAEEQPPLSLSERLFNYEYLPPRDAWKNIEAALQLKDEGVGNKVPVISQRPTHFLRFTMAAAMLGIVIVGILFFNNRASQKQDTVATAGLNSNNKVIQPDNSAVLSPSIADNSQDDLYEEEISINKPSRNNTTSDRILRNTKVQNSFLLASRLTAPIEARPIRNAAGDIIQDPQILNDTDPRYIDITSPSGQQTKISSKFLHMVMFLNDDNDVDQVNGVFDKNFLESLTWKSRFRDWRNKIISTSFVPSSTNFMDILEFRDLIQKDK